VVLGLVICSTYELSFNSSALIAALAANISECLQNVFSKKLLVSDRLDPHHLQLLTSISSLIIQVPCLLFLVDFPVLWQTVSSDSNLLLSYILNGVCFHCQSLSEYMLLYQISPVTHSVANTTKRALLILLSVMTFGNVVTPQSWLGTFIVFFGVYIYNKARSVKQHHEQITNTV
jgi:solute carrier family 35 protein E2